MVIKVIITDDKYRGPGPYCAEVNTGLHQMKYLRLTDSACKLILMAGSFRYHIALLTVYEKAGLLSD